MAHIKERKTGKGEKRFELRYRLPDGRERSETFKSRNLARERNKQVESDSYLGTLVDRRSARITLAEFADEVRRTNPKLADRARETYEGQLRLYVNPTLGRLLLGFISPRHVHGWYSELVQWAPRSMPAKAYERVRATMNEAVRQELIGRSPCNLRGVGAEPSAETNIVSADEVWALADEMNPRYRLAVLLAGFMALRAGEILGLSTEHVSLLHSTIKVDRQQQQLQNGTILVCDPKWGSRRTRPIPDVLIPEIERHLCEFATPGAEGRVFAGARGGLTRYHVLNKAFAGARARVGVDVTLHGLRHTALTIAGECGASLAQLQAMAGHSTVRAAMIYQHATDEGARRLVASMNEAAVAGKAAVA